MFNNKYGLNDAVLNGRKTMTRRIIPEKEAKRLDSFYGGDDWYYAVQTCIDESSRFDIGEVVAIAQSYQDIFDADVRDHYIPAWSFADDHCDEPGWNNKMFVRADLMPHQIEITDVKVERIQDITYKDCLKEGILESYFGYYVPGIKCKDWEKESHVDTEDGKPWKQFPTPEVAFKNLIMQLSGKKAWEDNPWVYVYSFKLIK